jgi:hypothetical protein
MVGSNTPMPRRFRFVALAGLLALSVAGLAACGSSGGGGAAGNASDLLKATFGPSHSVKSGRLAVALTFDSTGLKSLTGPVSLKVTGPFQTEGKGKLPQLDLNLALTSGTTSFTAGAVSTGDKGFLRLQGTTFAVDGPTFQKFKQGYESAAAKSSTGSPTLKSLGIDPLHWLKNPSVAGTETVGGASTYHIVSGVDVPTFLQDISSVLGKASALNQSTTKLPTSLTPQQRQDIASSVKSASLDVWTGKDDKALRRLRLVIDIAVPPAVRSRAGGLKAGQLVFDLSISELNQPQTITAPSNARPFSQLRQLLGGTTASTGSGSTTTPAPATTTPAAPSAGSSSSKYLTCLSKAGSDVAKIQQCAALVGQ